jgi:hypothetical protein
MPRASVFCQARQSDAVAKTGLVVHPPSAIPQHDPPQRLTYAHAKRDQGGDPTAAMSAYLA